MTFDCLPPLKHDLSRCGTEVHMRAFIDDFSNNCICFFQSLTEFLFNDRKKSRKFCRNAFFSLNGGRF